MALSGRRLFQELVAAARDFDARAPWDETADDETFALRIEGVPAPLFASVLGQAGLERGVAFFRGEGALDRLRDLLEHGDDEEDLRDSLSSLALLLQPLREIPGSFRRVLTQAGFTGRSEDTAPFFLSTSPGRVPREINASEAKILLLALRGTLRALLDGRLPPEIETGDALLTISVSGDPREPRIEFSNEIHAAGKGVETPPPESPVVAPPDLAKLPRLDERWLVGWPLSSMQIEGDERSIRTLMIVDEASERLLLLEPIQGSDAGKAARLVLDALDGKNVLERRGRPRETIVASRALFAALEPVLESCGCPCLYAAQIETLDAVSAAVSKAIAPGEEDDDDDDEEKEAPAADDLEGWSAANRRVSSEIAQAAEEDDVVTPRVIERYLGGLKMDLGDPAVADILPAMFESLLEWAAADYRPSKRGETLVERLLSERQSAADRALLEARTQAGIDLFRVETVRRGESVDLLGVLGGSRVTVHDRAMSESVAVGLVLPLRVFTAGRFRFGAPAGPPIQALELEEALRVLRLAGLGEAREGLAKNAHLLGRLWKWRIDRLEKCAAADSPQLANTDGENLVWHTARYAIADAAAARAALDSRPDVEREDDAGLAYGWFRDGSRNVPGRLSLGRMEFVEEEREIELQVNSAERFARADEFLSAIEGTNRKTVLRKKIERPFDLPPADPSSGSGEPPPPEAIQAVEQILTRHYLDWIDEPLPMLGGETPRRRCRTEFGRREVATLIREIPTVPGPGGTLIEPPREEMLRRLGLA